MISTSLATASFSSGEAPPSTPASTLGSLSGGASDASGQGADFGDDFRQVMSSYANSSSGNETAASGPASEKGSRNTPAPGTKATETSRAATGRFITGPPAGRQAPAEQQDANQEFSEQVKTAAEQAPNNQNSPVVTTTASASQATRLSALQILLRGGPLAQMLAVGQGTPAASQPGFVAPSASSDAATTESNLAAGIATAASSLLGTASAVSPQARPATSTGTRSKTDAVKGDGKATRPVTQTGETGAPSADINNVTFMAGQIGTSGPGGGAGTSSGPGPGGGAEATGSTAEALAVRDVGLNTTAAEAQPNNLAFAVRLTNERAQASSDSGNSAAGSESSPVAGAQFPHPGAAGQVETEAGGETGSHPGEHPEQASPAAALGAAGEAAAAGSTPAGSVVTSSESSAPAHPADPSATAGSQAVRDVHLQVTGDNNQRVDIRLVEVDGEMRVSVRAGDPKLAETLQQHIPDLAKNLDGQTVRAEIWSPRTESASQASNTNSGGQPSSSRGDASAGQGGGGQQRQGNGNQQQNQPDWVDELENYSSRNTTTTRSN